MRLIGFLVSLAVIPFYGIKWAIQDEHNVFYAIVFIVLFIYSIYALIIEISSFKKILKDIKAIKNDSYIPIEGKVIKFVKNIDLETGRQSNNKPIVEIVGTNDQVQLFIMEKVKRGETYIFHYLENSKIAEVIEKVENVNDADDDK